MKSKFIETHKKDWGPEFAHELKIEHTPEIDEVVSMSCYTMLYKIADEFADGIYRKEILKHFGVK